MAHRQKPRREDYTVGWVCALSIELAAAQEMLDEEHENFAHDVNDTNIYTLGRIGEHNIVIACLPEGQTGTSSAATVAVQMKLAFTSIRFSLMVGVGGGVPIVGADIRLGDVVVSLPNKVHGGVVQYDSGKTTPSGFERTGFLNTPPTILLNAVAKLRANHLRGKSKALEYVFKLNSLPTFARREAGPDILFEADYNHVGGDTCELCSKGRVVKRRSRDSREIAIHYGTIASGNQVMRDAAERDAISSELGGVLCFEMEAAGLMNSFPCLVIRGVCDYADSHKSKKWQAYAAGAAAAYAKEVLSIIPPAEVTKSRTVDEIITENNNCPRTPLLDQFADENLLRDLRAEILWARYEDVEEAHKDTFQWIFGGGCRPWDDFTAFLTGDEGIYWISGKAASGKSTLMKYISEEKQSLQKHLSRWTAGLPLGISTFFFWSGGTRAQRSQEGLFRSLLWQVLRTQPALIRLVFPDQWREFYNDAKQGVNFTRVTWSLSVLSEAFDLLINHTAISSKHFLLIDGLDEYEGNHASLAEAFKKLATSPSVKICLASRPLVVFEEQFGSLPRMRLQDITSGDIDRYVNDSLYQGKRLSWLKSKRPELAQELVVEIVQHADGVFLWVKLVVQSLLEGFGNDDDLPELQARMRLLPTELTDLYTYMLALGKDSPYFRAASEIFQLRQASDLAESMLVGATPPPFGLLDLYFATAEVPESGLSAEIALLSERQIETWCVATEKSLRKRCTGLLEVSGIKLSRYTYIRYLHRTVKEYLERPAIQQALLTATEGLPFDPHLSLLQACVMKLKGICTTMSWDMNELPSTLLLGLMHARLFEEARTLASLGPHPKQALLLDEIDRTMATILSDFMLRTKSPWFYQYGLLQRDRYDRVGKDGCRDSFLCLAVQFGLNQYVQTEIEKDGLGKDTIHKRGRPLLHHAVDALLKDTLSVSSFSGSRLAPQLLHYGANPNEVFNGSTIWHFFLIELYRMSSKANNRGERWFGYAQVSSSFIEKGADLASDIKILGTGDGNSPDKQPFIPSELIKPPELIRKLFGGMPASIRQLELRMSEMQSLRNLVPGPNSSELRQRKSLEQASRKQILSRTICCCIM